MIHNLVESVIIGSTVGYLAWSWFDTVMLRIERGVDDADVR